MEGTSVLDGIDGAVQNLEQALSKVSGDSIDSILEGVLPENKQKMCLSLAYTLITLRQAQLATGGEDQLPPQLAQALKRVQLLLRRI